MKISSWQVKLGIILLFSSFVIYFIKFLILGDPENTYYYVFNALGFLPINVFLVTLVLNEMLSMRARRERLEKLNMVIGIFFSEIGTDLLKSIACADRKISTLEETLRVTGEWKDLDFLRMEKVMKVYEFQIDFSKIDLEKMRFFLKDRRDLLLRLLENPMLLEHQSFTDVLRAVFHFNEEIARRECLSGLPESDCRHLEKDIERIYRLLSMEWLSYMKYLHAHYPYLSSLAMRTNPFDREAQVIVS